MTTDISTDLITPLGAYLRLREAGRGAFLLESVDKGRLGRHSFVGCGSRIVYLNEAEACGEPVVGYLGYDHIAKLEPTVPLPDDGYDLPESRFVIAEILVRFDHAAGVAEVSAATRPRSPRSSPARHPSPRDRSRCLTPGHVGFRRRRSTSAASASRIRHPRR